MPLPKSVVKTETFERVELNVIDINTKQIIFTGTGEEVANKFGVKRASVQQARRRKTRLLRKYAIRIKSDKQE